MKETERSATQKSLTRMVDEPSKKGEPTPSDTNEEIALRKDMKQNYRQKMIGETNNIAGRNLITYARRHSKKPILKKITTPNPEVKVILSQEKGRCGNEIISIMFEMKTEGDETALQKKKWRFS